MAKKGKQKQSETLSAINRVHDRIGNSLELKEISKIAVEELFNTVSCAACAILLMQRGGINILAVKGFSKMIGEGELNADSPIIKYVVDTKQSICTGDVANVPALGGVPGVCFSKSLICVPIVINDRVKGIIELDSAEENAFDEQDYGFVELMAKEVAMAIQHCFLQSQVQRLTVKDEVTKCYNRRKFDDDLEMEVARAKRYHRPLALLMIVVDWFQKYRDFHGPEKSDELLKELADLFRENVRGVDAVYRYEEAEFIILLPETTERNAFHVVRRLRRIVEQSYFEGEQESQPNRKITLSMEVAGYPWDGEGGEELLKSIAFAFYRAKRSGKDKNNVTSKVKSVKRAIRHLI